MYKDHWIVRRPMMMLSVSVMMASGAADLYAQETLQEQIAKIVNRDSITVLVTDSGLGGLSVAADIERRGRASHAYRSLRIIFANALPEANRGYNRMPSVERKVQVFDDALAGMIRWYHPDIILVACNTLSVLIPKTRSAHGTPLLGIVGMGVDMVEERLKAEPRSSAIIFGTETTIAAGTHRSLLIERGISPERIVTQACPDLAGQIETDAAGAAVGTAIERFAAEAAARVSGTPETIVAGLCCTHYGYCSPRFTASLQPFARSVEVVNPNERMADVLFPQGKAQKGDAAAVSVEVVSRAFISEGEIRSIASLIEPVSGPTASAFRAYERKRDLFPFQE